MHFIRSQRTTQVALILIFICSVALAIWSGNSLRYLDEVQYDQLAHSMLQRHVFGYARGMTLGRPPGYPFFLVAIYLVIDSPLAAKLVNCLALAASTYLLMRLSVRLYASKSALVPLAVLCYPLFFYAASTLYPQTLEGALLLATILLLADERVGMRNIGLAGVTFGYLCLAVPSFLYIMPLMALYVIYQWRHEPKALIVRSALLVIIACLTIAPWTIRNALEFGAFVPISANSGFNLAIGNSAYTPANGRADLQTACPDLQFTRDEVKFDRAMQACALRWIRSNPWPAFRLYVAKFLNYFNYRNELATLSEQEKPWQNWLVFATYYPLLGVSLLRLGFWRRYPLTSLEALLYIVYVINGAFTAVFFTRLRFRIPFDLLLIAIDAAFASYLLESWFRRPTSSARATS